MLYLRRHIVGEHASCGVCDLVVVQKYDCTCEKCLRGIPIFCRPTLSVSNTLPVFAGDTSAHVLTGLTRRAGLLQAVQYGRAVVRLLAL